MKGARQMRAALMMANQTPFAQMEPIGPVPEIITLLKMRAEVSPTPTFTVETARNALRVPSQPPEPPSPRPLNKFFGLGADRFHVRL